MPKVVLLFDLSSFKEAEPADYIDDSRDWQHFKPKSHTYYPQQERPLLIWQESFRKSKLGSSEVINHPLFKKLQEERELDEQGFPMVSSEWGFALHYRVAPRFIKGIIYKGNNPEDFVKNIENIYRDVYVDKLSQAIPVYDIDGNLLWPKQMNYEEVKKFVKERDKEKNQKE